MCAGNEDSLAACLGWNDKILGYPACSKDHQAGVVCENEDEEGKRLGAVVDLWKLAHPGAVADMDQVF